MAVHQFLQDIHHNTYILRMQKMVSTVQIQTQGPLNGFSSWLPDVDPSKQQRSVLQTSFRVPIQQQFEY